MSMRIYNVPSHEAQTSKGKYKGFVIENNVMYPISRRTLARLYIRKYLKSSSTLVDSLIYYVTARPNIT